VSGKKQYQKLYSLLLLLSLLIHVGGYVAYRFSLEIVEPKLVTPKTVTVQLKDSNKPPPPEDFDEQASKPVEEVSKAESLEEQFKEEEHAPVDNGDSFASNNQTDKAITEVVAGIGDSAPSEPAEILPEANRPEQTKGTKELTPSPSSSRMTEIQPVTGSELVSAGEPPAQNQANERVTTTSSTAASIPRSDNSTASLPTEIAGEAIPAATLVDELAKLLGAPVEQQLSDGSGFTTKIQPEPPNLDIPSDFLDRNGNLELLGEDALRDKVVLHPFSRKKNEELTLANKYLQRMNRQVRKHWSNPYKGGRLYAGIIRVKINIEGYLEDVWVYRSSGLPYLDESVISAIKAVKRFEVPDDEIIVARYYSRMSFHYTSIEGETELMPFEKDIANKEDS
jgi:outer membrane biosynthesis protein TonB